MEDQRHRDRHKVQQDSREDEANNDGHGVLALLVHLLRHHPVKDAAQHARDIEDNQDGDHLPSLPLEDLLLTLEERLEFVQLYEQDCDRGGHQEKSQSLEARHVDRKHIVEVLVALQELYLIFDVAEVDEQGDYPGGHE